MYALIQFIARLLGYSQKDLLEKLFKNMVLKSSKAAGASGGKNPLEDLLNQFKDKGLGNIVNSWVGTGPNHLITPEQVQHGLGEEHINALAMESGLPPEEVSKKLATLLPGMIDKMTPEGKVA
ncbi:hypothetical protein BH11PLA2_BH11PLA2_51380 [soil metagenome]